MKKCPTCNEWQASFLHKCRPEWLVLQEDWHGTLTDFDAATRVRAFSHEEAALEFAKLYDRDDCDYSIANGEPIVVRVKPNFETVYTVKEFTIRGEWEPVYTAEDTKPRPLISNFHMSIDPSIPNNEIHMIDHEGRVVSRLVGIGEPESC